MNLRKDHSQWYIHILLPISFLVGRTFPARKYTWVGGRSLHTFMHTDSLSSTASSVGNLYASHDFMRDAFLKTL